MHCKKCGKVHSKDHPHFKVVSHLSDKGFPTKLKEYHYAHEKANKAEEKKFGKKSFNELEKFVRGANKDELIGKNSKTGKIEVEKKVPKKLRKEVAYHEKVENKILREKRSNKKYRK